MAGRLCAIILLLGGSCVAGFDAQEGPAVALAYVRSFGEHGDSDGSHVRPTHTIALPEEAGTETLLVVDNGNGRVIKLRDGKQVATFGTGDGEDSLQTPTAIAVDGNILAVTDTKAHRVVVYNLKTGDFIRAVGNAEVLSHPISLRIHGNELWVVEYKGHRLAVLDFTTGELIRRVGEGGHLTEPRDLAFVGDEIVVTDTGSDRLVVFSHSGEFRRILGEAQTGVGKKQFKQPYGVDVIPGLAPGGGDALIVSDYAAQSGTVHIVDPATGAELTDQLKFIIEPDGTKRVIGGLNYIHVDMPAMRAFVGCMQTHQVHELTFDPAKAERVKAEQLEAWARKKEEL